MRWGKGAPVSYWRKRIGRSRPAAGVSFELDANNTSNYSKHPKLRGLAAAKPWALRSSIMSRLVGSICAICRRLAALLRMICSNVKRETTAICSLRFILAGICLQTAAHHRCVLTTSQMAPNARYKTWSRFLRPQNLWLIFSTWICSLDLGAWRGMGESCEEDNLYYNTTIAPSQNASGKCLKLIRRAFRTAHGFRLIFKFSCSFSFLISWCSLLFLRVQFCCSFVLSSARRRSPPWFGAITK